MSLKSVTIQVVGAILCEDQEMQPGSSARLYLDTATDPGLPEYIHATVQMPVSAVSICDPATGCIGNGTSYIFAYESDDLLGVLPALVPDNVLSVKCVTGYDDLDHRVTELEAENVTWRRDIDALTGGTLTSLDYVPTELVDVGELFLLRLNGELLIYELIAGTNAEQEPVIVRPDDYDATDNAKVWKLRQDVDQLLWKGDFDALTGGSATALDSLPTLVLKIGTMVGLEAGGLFYLYQLASGTDAEAAPKIVRPDDYAASTNEKVWKLLRDADPWVTAEAKKVLEGTGDQADKDAFGVQTGSPVADPSGVIHVIPGLGDTHDQILDAGVLGLDEFGGVVRHDGVTEGGRFLEPIRFAVSWTPAEYAAGTVKPLVSIPLRAGQGDVGDLINLKGSIRKMTREGGFALGFALETVAGSTLINDSNSFAIGDGQLVTVLIDTTGGFTDFSPPNKVIFFDSRADGATPPFGAQANEVFGHAAAGIGVGSHSYLAIAPGSYNGTRAYDGLEHYLTLYAGKSGGGTTTVDQGLYGEMLPTFLGAI